MTARVGYYVTVIRNVRGSRAARRVGWLAGPFARHEDALALVERARRLANRLDPWTEFDAFGTSSMQPPRVAGRLNELLTKEMGTLPELVPLTTS